MIFHDDLWKDELKRLHIEVGSIDVANLQEDKLFECERPIFYAAFIIRKLIEDTAVTDRLKSQWIELKASASNRSGREFFLEYRMGPLEVSDWFDLENREPIRISYSDFASEIIHSDAFVWNNGSGAPGEFLVCSYRNRLKRLLWVPLPQFVGLIEKVANDRPTKWWIEKDLNSGQITAHAE